MEVNKMKISWIFWWIISAIEVLSFIGFSILLWMRDIDASGAIQTTQLKWANIAVLGFAFLFPFAIQVAWLITNLVLSKNKLNQS
jgi:membrane-anchored protein YejM (alkaline phosphatase superfamily)